MSLNNIKLILTLWSLSVVLGFGCNHPEHKEHDEDGHEEHGHAEHGDEEDGHKESSHEGHDHEGHGGGDLDRTVEELFAESCEHAVLAHKCDECRYEVGVAKVVPDLIEQGLIEVQEVVERNFDKELELTGEIKFDERKIAHLGPRVTGVVRKVNIDVGQGVTAGTVLVELDSAALAEAESDYLEALATKRLAKNSFDRQTELRDAKISSEKEYLEAKQQHEAAAIRVNSAKQKLSRFGHGDGRIKYLARTGIKAATGRLQLVAPFDGEILELHAVRGERIEPGGEMLLIGDIRTLWLLVDLYETQLNSVSEGMQKGKLPASIRVAAFKEKRFLGEVDFVGRVMDERTRTVKARIVLDNTGGFLRPGMFANARLGLDALGGQIAVPSGAILSDEGREFVFIQYQENYFVRRLVSRGRTMDGYVEILGDLKVGQKIAVKGSFLLKSDVLRSKMGAGCAH